MIEDELPPGAEDEPEITIVSTPLGWDPCSACGGTGWIANGMGDRFICEGCQGSARMLRRRVTIKRRGGHSSSVDV